MAWHISPGQSFVVLRFPNRSLGFYACHIRKHPIILMWLGHSLYHNFSLSDLRTLTDPYLGQFYHPQMRHHFQSNINVNSIKSPSEYANSLSKKLRVLFDLTFRVSCLYFVIRVGFASLNTGKKINKIFCWLVGAFCCSQSERQNWLPFGYK